MSDKTESPAEHLEQHPTIQAKARGNHGKSGRIASRQTTVSSSVSRQPHQSSPQKPSPSITSQPQTGRATRNLRNSSDLISETEVTPEVNFVSVNAHGEEIDVDQDEEDGLGTLDKVWSMNQVEHLHSIKSTPVSLTLCYIQGNNEGEWENDTGTLHDGTLEEVKRYASPSESDHSEYRQYAEPLNVPPSISGDLPLIPSSSTQSNWAPSSAGRTNSSRGVKGKI